MRGLESLLGKLTMQELNGEYGKNLENKIWTLDLIADIDFLNQTDLGKDMTMMHTEFTRSRTIFRTDDNDVCAIYFNDPEHPHYIALNFC